MKGLTTDLTNGHAAKLFTEESIKTTGRCFATFKADLFPPLILTMEPPIIRDRQLSMTVRLK
ncbi:MAG: hypothetical protein C0490_13370 [Marivirga sp.]|nr:hypothetical protein [Marivirga sp.]